MGKAIETIALARGHEIVARIDMENKEQLANFNENNTDVVIEFSEPTSAFSNIRCCLENNIAVVSGTTGWLDKKPEIDALCLRYGGAFFYASNYSIGVNLFFELNKYLARLMDGQGYESEMEEIHHTQKKDAPSGTAITLAEGITGNHSKYRNWKTGKTTEHEIGIVSKRIDPAPGTHIIKYTSAIDDVEIKHTAHSREGFATGAVLVAEWIKGKKGVLTMQDFLGELKK